MNDPRPENSDVPPNPTTPLPPVGGYPTSGTYHPDSAYPGPDTEPQYVPDYPYGYPPAAAGYGSAAYGSAAYGSAGYGSAGYGGAGYPPGYSAPGYAASYPGYPQPGPYGQPTGYPYGAHPAYAAGGYPLAGPSTAPSTKRRAVRAAGSVLLAVALVLAGAGIAEYRHSDTSSTAQLPGIANGGGNTTPGSVGGGSTFPGGTGVLPGGSGGTGQNGQSTSAAVATATQQVGVVTVVSVLGYQTAESAGTGMILNSDGDVLTNNHVINGATSITVTVESTGKQYRADVVGTAPTKDVAVIKLRDASGLTPAKIDRSSSPSVGDGVTGVGNAGGTGTLRAASGKITALSQSITASDEQGQNPEKLTGLIQTDAGIVSGDSGGPLYDSSGSIIGMDTAASTSNSTTQAAYAIPIGDAVSVADQIESGTETSVIHIGLPAFIGVTVLQTTSGGAAIETVVPDGPADKAGITGGSVITAVGSTSVADAAALKAALSAYKPGQSVSLTWTDASGTSHTASTTLIAGPAD